MPDPKSKVARMIQPESLKSEKYQPWSHGRGVDVRAMLCAALETEWSSTPLGWAARKGKKEMVQWLLKKGANPNLPNDEHWALPIEWAKRRGHHEIAELLKNSGAE